MIDNNTGMNTAISISRIDVIEAITEVVEGLLQDQVKNFMKGDVPTLNMFSSYKGIPDWDNVRLANTWCDLCSERFFDDNEGVDEVLMDTTVLKSTDNNGGRGGIVQKMWLASREDVRITTVMSKKFDVKMNSLEMAKV